MIWNPVGKRRDQRLEAMEDLRCAQRFLREELAAFDEQLDQLQADLSAGLSATEDGAMLADYERARSAYDAVRTAAHSAETVPALVALEPLLHEGRYHLACALARRDGVDLPTRRDPCFFNPQHGPAVTDAAWTPLGGVERGIAVCRLDADQLAAGKEPDVRLVRVGDRLVPWYEAGGSIMGVVQHADIDRTSNSVRQQAAEERMNLLGKNPPRLP
jgi:hypothetical protein